MLGAWKVKLSFNTLKELSRDIFSQVLKGKLVNLP